MDVMEVIWTRNGISWKLRVLLLMLAGLINLEVDLYQNAELHVLMDQPCNSTSQLLDL
jgi:hypothetical protein